MGRSASCGGAAPAAYPKLAAPILRYHGPDRRRRLHAQCRAHGLGRCGGALRQSARRKLARDLRPRGSRSLGLHPSDGAVRQPALGALSRSHAALGPWGICADDDGPRAARSGGSRAAGVETSSIDGVPAIAGTTSVSGGLAVLAQGAAQDLADVGLWQLAAELDVFRPLVAGELTPA